MGERAWSGMLLSLCAFSLLCLALSGASRLIASPERDERLSPCVETRAFLTADKPEDAGKAAAREQPAPRFAARAVQPGRFALPVPSGAARDANGNVLARARYPRAVYWAFALGDGFV